MYRWVFWAFFSLGLLAFAEAEWGAQEEGNIPTQDQQIEVRISYDEPPGGPPPPPPGGGGDGG